LPAAVLCGFFVRADAVRALQVRVDAVAALRNLVDAFHADDLASIKPLIPNLLNQLFALMQEVGTASACMFSVWPDSKPKLALSMLGHYLRCLKEGMGPCSHTEPSRCPRASAWLCAG
jgi:hypothetical protein